jgi:voltage-gated potassium channel
MKSVITQILSLGSSNSTPPKPRLLVQFLAGLVCLIGLYSVGFHLLMLREGQEHTWLTGLYWTLTVMSTLGFGDITFHTDLGRAFSILVLLSGVLFLLVLLPFIFIEFFYKPWFAAQAIARVPKGVDPKTRDHILITNYDAMAAALIRRCQHHRIDYVVVLESEEEAIKLQDEGVKVALGELDNPETYLRVLVNQAALVVATSSDVINTSIAFTVREITRQVRIVATAQSDASADVIRLAGCNDVIRPEEIVGQWFRRRIPGESTPTHIIGHMEGVLVAEVSAEDTSLVGKSLSETNLREISGVNVVGTYSRGKFEAASANTVVRKGLVLVLAASKDGLARFNAEIAISRPRPGPVLILGGGRVGRATAMAVAKDGGEYRVVEQDPSRIRPGSRDVLGDAASYEVLQKAGIEGTGSIVITTHDDDLNVFLTIYCRKLRPDVQILARASSERHVATLHRAGADYVVSYVSTGASMIMSQLRQHQIVQVAEGLEFLRFSVPAALAGRSIRESGIREQTGCTLVALTVDGNLVVVPGPDETLAAGSEMILMGVVEDHQRFFTQFASPPRN